MTENPLHGWQVDREAITFVGRDLQRPECILAEPDGTLWSADARGGVMRIDPDGTQELVAQGVDTRFSDSGSVERYTMNGTLPNGLAFAPNGDFLIANFGTDAIERMTRDGVSTTLYTDLDGEPLGKTNFVLADSQGRIWFTVTTRLQPWTRSVNERVARRLRGPDRRPRHPRRRGRLRRHQRDPLRRATRSGSTWSSRTRAASRASAPPRTARSATGRSTGRADLGGIPDGFAFDAAGNLWITLVNADRLIALTPEGEVLTLLDDGDPEKVAVWDAHFFGRDDHTRDPQLGTRHPRADDGERHLRRPRPAHRLRRAA